MKGFLRKCYGRWACSLTVDQLTSGVKPTAIKIPADVPSLKQKLMEWLSTSVDEANKDVSQARRCWQSTTLLNAWDRTIQNEAKGMVKELFLNIEDVQVVIVIDNPEAPTPTEVDVDAGYSGTPFLDVQDEDEYDALVEEMSDWFN